MDDDAQDVLECLVFVGGGPMTTQSLAHETEISVAQVEKALAALEQAGDVERTPKGEWQVRRRQIVPGIA